MNDEQMIWKSYTSIYSEDSDSIKEFSEEDFIYQIIGVSGISKKDAEKVFSYYTHDSERHNKTEHHKMLKINPSNGKYIIDDYNNYLLDDSYITNVLMIINQSRWDKPKIEQDKSAPTNTFPQHLETVEYSEEEIIRHIMQAADLNEKQANAVWENMLTASFKRVHRNDKNGKYIIHKYVLDPEAIRSELNFIPWYDLYEHKIYYHAGRFPINVKNVKFDMGALGFHLGSERLVEYISKGSYKKNSGLSHRDMEMGKRLKISKFKVKATCGMKYIVDCNEDMPWEDPLLLSVYLYYQGIISKDDAKMFLNHFEVYDMRDDDDYDFWKDRDDEDTSYHIALDKIERSGGSRSGSNYHPADDIPMMSEHGRMYKDSAGLEFIRKYLSEELNYAAIEYVNTAEGIHVKEEDDDEEMSICILDPCILEDA